jgi:hypothetical protein
MMRAVVLLFCLSVVIVQCNEVEINLNFADLFGHEGHIPVDINGPFDADTHDVHDGDCSFINHASLKAALELATCNHSPCDPHENTPESGENAGFNLHMWGTVVNRAGRVCAVAYTGPDVGAQWLGSRVISAQKASTGNSFSLNGLALSSANLYAPTQPGASLFGLQESNPVNTKVAYAGELAAFGTSMDPMIGGRIGGINVFGGGLGLYNSARQLVGGIGVSGDSACADHAVAWKARHALGLDYIPGNDNIMYPADHHSGFGHPHCLDSEYEDEVKDSLPAPPTWD